MKRTIDIIISFIAIIVLLPILIPICIILVLTGEHEIIYFQKRIGKDLRNFNIWKFATMLKNSEKLGHGIITVRNDSRVLPFGKFLRMTKINEIPQLINILIGDMSIVGPRPLIYNPYAEGVGEKIYSNKPGLTGIGSIMLRDEEILLSNTLMDKKEFYDNHISPYKAKLELWYYCNRSFLIDLKIILTTMWVVIFPYSKIIDKWFPKLPEMPDNLKKLNKID